MSMRLMAIAMSAKVGNPARKLVLLKLCDNANDKGECWPSLQHIADQCEISRRTAINHVQALADDGFLVVENRFKNNEQISNFYIIDLDRKSKSEKLGGENSALPPSENSALGSEKTALGGENIAPPPSEKSAHRTSHSLESVKEPVNKYNDYPDWFVKLLERYPPRSGSNDKRKAFQAVSARIKEGKTIEQITAAVDRYRLFVIANNRINTEFTLMAASFFGPGGHIENLWSISSATDQQRNNYSGSKPAGLDPDDTSWADELFANESLGSVGNQRNFQTIEGDILSGGGSAQRS